MKFVFHWQEIGYKEVSLSHRSGLPYTQAALLEVQRLATVAPLVPREAAQDASLAGHKLPKGTALLINLWWERGTVMEWLI